MPHILILMSDTGGGHRAAAEAIRDAVDRLDVEQRFTVDLIDILKRMAIPPWNHLDSFYRFAVAHLPWLWGVGFKLASYSPLRTGLTALNAAVAGPRLLHWLRGHSADLVVSVHPLATAVPGRILRHLHPGVPFATVVTDLASVHPLWLWKGADATFVGSEEARRCALRAGVPADTVEIMGLPIDLRCAEKPGRKEELKREYGLPGDRALVLLVGGGEGMGDLEGYARAVSGSGLPVSLMVVTGRNERLQRRLTAIPWEVPTQVTGFVRDMPRRMAAGDLLITKAGPATLCEGLAAGLPIFVTGFVPGQEEGNVRWIIENRAGRLTLTPRKLAAALHDLFDGQDRALHNEEARKAALSLARPDAALTLAEHLMRMAEEGVARQEPRGRRVRLRSQKERQLASRGPADAGIRTPALRLPRPRWHAGQARGLWQELAQRSENHATEG